MSWTLGVEVTKSNTRALLHRRAVLLVWVPMNGMAPAHHRVLIGMGTEAMTIVRPEEGMEGIEVRLVYLRLEGTMIAVVVDRRLWMLDRLADAYRLGNKIVTLVGLRYR